MSSSSTVTESGTFTVTHAKRIASKVAADLLRLQRFYINPTTAWIDAYEAELVELLAHDVLNDVVYGFQRNGKWTEAALKYVALPGGELTTDDDPGKIRANLDITGAHFTSFLTYNAKWHAMSATQQAAIRAGCTFQRGTATAPPLEVGNWVADRNYSAGGRGLGRNSVQR